MKCCWFSLSALTMSPHPISTLAPAAHLFFSLSHFCASVLWRDWLYLAVLLALFSFPASHLFFIFPLTLARSLLYHTLILSDVKLIALPLFLPLSPSLCGVKVIMVDGALGGLWCVCVCVCGSDDDGMLRDRWKVRHGARLQMEASVCHLLSAVLSTGCVTAV